MRGAAALVALTLFGGCAAAPPTPALAYHGQQILPAGLRFDGMRVGGLSGLDHVPARGIFVALSDHRGGTEPARFYDIALDLARFRRAAEPGHEGVRILAVTPLRRADGRAYAPFGVDPEALRWDAARGQFLWADEGRRNRFGLLDPALRAAGADGRERQAFPVPQAFLPRGSVGGGEAQDRGVRDNRGFEGLALSTDGRTAWAALENALVQDDDAATPARGSNVRVVAFDIEHGSAGAQFVYPVGPVVRAPMVPGGVATNGLTELLALGERRFIAVERSFSAGALRLGDPGHGVTVRLYLVDARDATDVSDWPSLRGRDLTPARKTLLLDLADLRHDDGSPLAVDNIEGLSFGPDIDGRRTLILVSDDNFNAQQRTQFIALVVHGDLR